MKSPRFFPENPRVPWISDTESGIIDPLASKRPEKIWNKKIKKIDFKQTVAWVTRPERPKGVKEVIK